MSPVPELDPPAEAPERRWLPMAIASAVVAIAILIVFLLGRGKTASTVTPITAQADAYATSLTLTQIKMSESGNLAGGKLTYLDGRVTNQGERTVTAITVQVLFRNYTHEVAQNETLPLKLIRVREPYIDVQSVSSAPIKPGEEREFRLIFDAVSPNWDGAYPEIRVLRVETK